MTGPIPASWTRVECGCGKVRYVPPSELREIFGRLGPYRCKSCAAVVREQNEQN